MHVFFFSKVCLSHRNEGGFKKNNELCSQKVLTGGAGVGGRRDTSPEGAEMRGSEDDRG